MTNLAELIDDLAKKAGLSGDHEGLKAIINASTGIAIDSEIEQALTSNLLSIQAAKSNVAVKNHHISHFAKSIDEMLDKRLQKLGFSEEDMNPIFEEKSTGKRVDMTIEKMVKKMESLEASQKKSGKDGDKDLEKTYKDQIEKLNNEMNSLRETHLKDIDNERGAHSDYVKNSIIESEFLKHKWSENFTPDLRKDLSKIALEKELNKMGAKIVKDEKGELKLVQVANPELEYFDSTNKKITFTELVPHIMATNKFIAVSASTDPGTSTNPIVGGGKLPDTPKGNNTVTNLLNKSLQDQNQI